MTDIPTKTRKIVDKLDKNRCVLCGSLDNLGLHHIHTRGSHIGSHEVYNLITLCFNCHRKMHDGIYIRNKNGKVFMSGKQYLYYRLKKIEKSKNFRFQEFIKWYEYNNEATS